LFHGNIQIPHNFQNGSASMLIWKKLQLLGKNKNYILKRIKHQLKRKKGRAIWWLPNVPFLLTFDQKRTWWLPTSLFQHLDVNLKAFKLY
jgi:hypothetical protein